MIYYTNLEDKIFSNSQYLSDKPDEIIVISGFIGPIPVERLKELNLKTTVVGGMYSMGLDNRLWNALNSIKENNSNLKLYFSNMEIHSKLYIWKKGGKTVAAYIGSANFSKNGLNKDYRESLADLTSEDFDELDKYIEYIMSQVTDNPIIIEDQRIIQDRTPNTPQVFQQPDTVLSAELTLLGSQGEVPPFSGLNWGLSRHNGSHTSIGDAYVPIHKDVIRQNPGLVKAFNPNYHLESGTRKRNSDPIELIWDDGVVMEALLEGEQELEGSVYPKQIASFSSKKVSIEGKPISNKSILGRYLRNRLKVGIDDVITKDLLDSYGRSTITLSLLSDGIYFADFSV